MIAMLLDAFSGDRVDHEFDRRTPAVRVPQTCLEVFVPLLEAVQAFLAAHDLDDPTCV